jgi:hypothetical protein
MGTSLQLNTQNNKPLNVNTFLLIKNCFNETGLTTNTFIKKGMLIGIINGQELTYPTKYSIQINEFEHIEPDNYFRYINHHCNPNAFIKGKNIMALRDIQINEEILIDYLNTEDYLSHPFKCHCCGKEIKGKSFNLFKTN